MAKTDSKGKICKTKDNRAQERKIVLGFRVYLYEDTHGRSFIGHFYLRSTITRSTELASVSLQLQIALPPHLT